MLLSVDDLDFSETRFRKSPEGGSENTEKTCFLNFVR